MANILTLECTDDVVTLGLDDADLLIVGQMVVVSGTDYNKLNGVHTLTAVDTDLDEVQYLVNNQDDIEQTAVDGPVLSASVDWVDSDDVEVWLGIATATANDTAFLEYCVDAANCYAFRVRWEAGYKDSPAAAPCPSAKLGTIQLAAIYYRERGSVDGFQSFEQLGTATPFGSMMRIKQLLGINKPNFA